YEKPLLIVPPWINKFYILDLNPEKSFIRWAVEQGFTVFVISWVNPDEQLAQKTFADYMHEGILAACAAVEKATGAPQVNAIGYCIGGTLLSATLAYLAAKGKQPISSATFFTTQVDFTLAGDLKVFVDEEQITAVEQRMAEKGYMEGGKMSKAFNLLRSNDLIWSYVVNNYLKGKEPFPFDLLYWNADPTRMPAATHSYYLRECYLYNNMSQGRMELDGETIDLSKVKIPVYNLATREDHIAPLPSAFKLGQFFGGKTQLVVAGSGHIAGVVNPPSANKYQYWLNDEDVDNLEEWLDRAEEHAGSWWPHWAKWTAQHSGKKVKARKPGDGKLKPLEDAPGSYVKVRS
ncbi:MAG: alpha/beta fold hydrolase, partial [Pseudomonadota bacterium]